MGSRRAYSAARGGIQWARAVEAKQFSIDLNQTRSSLSELNKTNLVSNIYMLWRSEQQVDDLCKELCLTSSATSLAGALIDELDCKSTAEVMSLVSTQMFRYGARNDSDVRSLTEFIDRSLEK